MFNSKHNNLKSGFTLVEMLVVIAIIAAIMGLLLPAVNSARESARQLQCKNNLKQMGLAFQSHHEANGFWPVSGWGFGWMGDPNKGFSRNQPGGWLYNILPYAENGPLHDLGLGAGATDADGGLGNAVRKAAICEQTKTPTKYMNCPTRRPNKSYTNTAQQTTYNANKTLEHARTDYAVNGGNYPNPQMTCDLPSCAGSSSAIYKNPTVANWNKLDKDCGDYGNDRNSGISYIASQYSESDVKDGLSNTLCVAEKYLTINDYFDGTCGSDNGPAYQGYDWDNTRWGPAFKNQSSPTKFDRDENLTPILALSNNVPNPRRVPIQDLKTYDEDQCIQYFGSAHAALFQGVMCDGSVRAIPYSVDWVVLACYCNRTDGTSIESIKLE